MKQLQPHPHYPWHQPGPSSVSVTATTPTCNYTSVAASSCLQSSTVSLQSHHPLDHTLKPFYFQVPVLQYPHTQFVQSTTPYNSASAVDDYASYLMSLYTRDKLPIYDKWPQVKSKEYINLALIEKEDITKPEEDQFIRNTIHGNIDDIRKSKRAMNIDQIAQLPDGSQPKCILVEGGPGVGKSTFAWKLCHMWGNRKLLQQYQLVVLLRLRDRNVQAAKSISDLFWYHQHHIQKAPVKEIHGTGGKGVLLLFEGYDELPEELRAKCSIFLDVITGRELPEATVLITSRPWASEFLHKECKRHLSQHVEILGFTQDNIQSYLQNTITNDLSLLNDLKKYISFYPHINSLMYIPLNCAIVVEVYRNNRKDDILVPKTMTELYSSLVRSLLLRHLFDHPVHGKRRWRVRSFDDLPQDVYQQLCELSKIAYEGILHDQQVIFCDLPEGFETLGLMQCVPELYVDEGIAVSYNFLHLTVQEYLAAFHLSQQPVEEQIKHFRLYKSCNKHHHFHMVLRFLCGVKKFIGYPSEELYTLCLKTSSSTSAVREVTFDTLQLLFEVQDSIVIAQLLGSSVIQLIEPYDEVTLFDCFVLGYCVSHSNCSWKIALRYHNIGDEGVELLVRGAVEEKTHCRGTFSEINLSMNGITSKGVQHLLHFPKQIIHELKALNLHSNDFDSESCTVLAHLIPHVPHLKKLNLFNNTNIGQGGVVSLIESLTAHSSLEELGLTHTRIGVDDCQAVSKLLSSSKSLKELGIGSYGLPPEAVEHIIFGLHHNDTLQWLYMNDSHFAVKNTISLASVLQTNCTLVHLYLAQCDIDSGGACWLASALCTNDTLQELYLERNPIGVEGAAAFSEMLLKNKSLKVLNLQDDSIGEKGTQKLIDSLSYNVTIKELYLPERYKSSIVSRGIDSRTSFSELV